jgi:hypothetical protein
LESLDRSFGQKAITAIDRTRRIAGRRQQALQRPHHLLAAGFACPEAQNEDWFAKRGPRTPAYDAVHLQAVRRLERKHCPPGSRPEESVDATGRIAPRLEITLQDAHRRRTAAAAVAAT